MLEKFAQAWGLDWMLGGIYVKDRIGLWDWWFADITTTFNAWSHNADSCARSIHRLIWKIPLKFMDSWTLPRAICQVFLTNGIEATSALLTLWIWIWHLMAIGNTVVSTSWKLLTHVWIEASFQNLAFLKSWMWVIFNTSRIFDGELKSSQFSAQMELYVFLSEHFRLIMQLSGYW